MYVCIRILIERLIAVYVYYKHWLKQFILHYLHTYTESIYLKKHRLLDISDTKNINQVELILVSSRKDIVVIQNPCNLRSSSDNQLQLSPIAIIRF